MNVEKGKTVKYLKEKMTVDKEVMNNLKSFTRSKKAIINSLKEGGKTVPQLAKELEITTEDCMYLLMSLLKYGYVKTGEIDDMDEYFAYELTEKTK
jgi:predicted transcriptional regulator